jgi:hypothetical protein
LKNGVCEFEATCYGFHSKNAERNNNEPKKPKGLVCKKCNTVPENFEYAVLGCKDVICINCSIETFTEGLPCPICRKDVEKNANTYMKYEG